MLFSSAEAKEHTKSYVTEVYVTQKKEKMPSYLLFASAPLPLKADCRFMGSPSSARLFLDQEAVSILSEQTKSNGI